jgi:glycosyltransferase domain-containing protein
MPRFAFAEKKRYEMTSPRVTCLIPTHNHPQFLRRLLAYYSEFSPVYPVVVVDFSKPEESEENRATVSECQRKFGITYRHDDTDFLSKCIRALEIVKTPFVALCADDDVLFPETVLQCAEFLSHNPGYSSALGRVALLRPSNPKWTTQVLRGYSIEDDSSLERCRRLADVFFTNFYAVYRTEVLLENYLVTAQHTDASANSLLPEMLLGQLSVLRGRLKGNSGYVFAHGKSLAKRGSSDEEGSARES